MEVKIFEVRDAATFIPMMAVKMGSRDSQETWLLRRAGYGPAQAHGEYVVLCEISGGGGRCYCDPYDWTSRTHQVAHDYIVKNFEELAPGSVVDVEHILGKKPKPKLTERLEHPEWI